MRLRLYLRQHCHLCEDMLLQLQDWQTQLGFELETVDIDRDPALVEQYNTLVPVLMAGDREVCHYFLDEKALLGHFSRD